MSKKCIYSVNTWCELSQFKASCVGHLDETDCPLEMLSTTLRLLLKDR